MDGIAVGAYERLGGVYPQGEADYDVKHVKQLGVSPELLDEIVWVSTNLGQRISDNLFLYKEEKLNIVAGNFPPDDPFYGGRAYVNVTETKPILTELVTAVGNFVLRYNPDGGWERYIRGVLVPRANRASIRRQK